MHLEITLRRSGARQGRISLCLTLSECSSPVLLYVNDSQENSIIFLFVIFIGSDFKHEYGAMFAIAVALSIDRLRPSKSRISGRHHVPLCRVKWPPTSGSNYSTTTKYVCRLSCRSSRSRCYHPSYNITNIALCCVVRRSLPTRPDTRTFR